MSEALDALILRGVVKRQASDTAWAQRALDQADNEFSTALDRLHLVPADAQTAAGLLWDAALHGFLAILRVEGLRLVNQKAHHAAAIEVAQAIVNKPEMETTFRQLSWLSRQRNTSLYDLRPVDPELIESSVTDVESLLDYLRKDLQRRVRTPGE